MLEYCEEHMRFYDWQSGECEDCQEEEEIRAYQACAEAARKAAEAFRELAKSLKKLEIKRRPSHNAKRQEEKAPCQNPISIRAHGTGLA